MVGKAKKLTEKEACALSFLCSAVALDLADTSSLVGYQDENWP